MVEVFDPEGVAVLLRCSVKTVEERARRGDLPGLKFGDGWIFPAEALAQRLNELALEESRVRGQPVQTSSVLHAIAKRPTAKRKPPALPDLT